MYNYNRNKGLRNFIILALMVICVSLHAGEMEQSESGMEFILKPATTFSWMPSDPLSYDAARFEDSDRRLG